MLRPHDGWGLSYSQSLAGLYNESLKINSLMLDIACIYKLPARLKDDRNC
jgi:hypothetical protein